MGNYPWCIGMALRYLFRDNSFNKGTGLSSIFSYLCTQIFNTDDK